MDTAGTTIIFHTLIGKIVIYQAYQNFHYLMIYGRNVKNA